MRLLVVHLRHNLMPASTCSLRGIRCRSTEQGLALQVFEALTGAITVATEIYLDVLPASAAITRKRTIGKGQLVTLLECRRHVAIVERRGINDCRGLFLQA